MLVTVIQPLHEQHRDYRPGDTFESPDERAYRLAELGYVEWPGFQDRRRDEAWRALRRLINARPTAGPLAFPTRRSQLADLRPGERLLIIRKYGGLGDILISSMLFPDLRDQYPDIHVTYALPHQYFSLFEGTGLTLYPYEQVFSGVTHDAHRGTVKSEFLEQFDLVEDISIPCHVWENLFTRFGGVDGGYGLKWRNRLDMWSRWMGLTVRNPRTIIILTDGERDAARQRLRRYGPPPYLLLAPFTGNRTKNYPWFQELGQALAKEWTVLLLHSTSLNVEVGIPMLSGLTIRAMGAVAAVADMIVTSDTAAFHWGGILGTPTVGLFNVNDGATYCKYYPKAVAVQCCDTPCINVKYLQCGKQYPGNLPSVPNLGLEVSRCFHPASVQTSALAVEAHARACGIAMRSGQ